MADLGASCGRWLGWALSRGRRLGWVRITAAGGGARSARSTRSAELAALTELPRRHQAAGG